MQTSIQMSGRRAGTIVALTAALRNLSRSVSTRISALTERTWLRLSMAMAVALIISAGRYSATEAQSDLVMVAVTSIASLIALALADARSEK